MRVLFLGDIVGAPGRQCVINNIASLKQEYGSDVIIVNGENSAGGRGITPSIATMLLDSGVNVITSGDHIWDQKEIIPYLKVEPRVLRPLNYPEDTPGNGYHIVDTEKGSLAVLNGQGRTFMNSDLENPFLMLEELIVNLRKQGVKMIFLDFHAETTSESIAMGYHLDGKVSAVVGTHTHVQTADERILPRGTAHHTDAGMCGPDISILGRNVESVVWRFRTATPTRFPVAKGDVRLCGTVIDIDSETGKATHVERLNRLFPVESN